MGTTPLGFPYPEATDPVAQGADAIKALAQVLNAKHADAVPVRMVMGYCRIATAAAAGTIFTDIDLARDGIILPAAPICFASISSGGTGSAKAIVRAWALDASTVRVSVYSGDGTQFPANTGFDVAVLMLCPLASQQFTYTAKSADAPSQQPTDVSVEVMPA